MIDFHCHLDLYPNAKTLFNEVAKKNYFTLVVTTSPYAWKTTSRVFAGHSNIKVALGLHPEIAGQKTAERELLISFISDAEFIGEVGIDGSAQHTVTVALQESILKDVLVESERCGGRILSVHSRNAAGLVLDYIEQYCRNSIPVLHWFSGTLQETRRAVDLGCWFSIGPLMLRGAKGKKILNELPKEKVLPETDGPFARKGSLPFMPWEAIKITKHAASVWNMSIGKVEEQLKHNLKILLST